MKKRIIFAIVFAALLSACKKQSFDEQVLQDVKSFNEKEAPKRLDEVTTYDSAHYDQTDRTLSFYYTIEGNITADMLPQAEIDKFLQGHLNALRSSIQYKIHKEHNCKFRYVYILQQSQEILIDRTFTPEEYK